jgi:hypothetical protein
MYVLVTVKTINGVHVKQYNCKHYSELKEIIDKAKKEHPNSNILYTTSDSNDSCNNLMGLYVK